MKKKLIILFFIILLVGVLCIVNNKCRTLQSYDGNYLKRESNEVDDNAPEIDVSYSNENKTKDNVTVTLSSNEEISRVTNGVNFFDSNITYTSEYYEAVSNEQYNLIPYGLITPSTANDKDKLVPLIVWLHGDYESDVMGNPNALPSVVVNNKELKKFNAYILCPHSKGKRWWDNPAEDIKKLSTLLEYIVEKLGNVDTTNIVLVGHSGGAAGAVYMAGHMDELSYKFSRLVLMSAGNVRSIGESEKSITIPTRGYYGSAEDPYYIGYMTGKYYYIPNAEPSISIPGATHNAVPKNAFNIDENNDNCSDLIEWLLDGPGGKSEELPIGWELTEDNMVLTKTYTENSIETIEVYDFSGNKTQVQINISNIDKTVPELQINYDKTEMTNSNVKVTVIANEEIQEVSGWELSTNKKELTKTYTENRIEIIEIHDLAGNKEQVQVEVKNIDKTGPELDIRYNKTEITNSNVEVTIKSNEEIQEVNGWELSTNKKELTKTYTDNVTEIIEVYDLIGNKSQIHVNIENIDKIGPEIEIRYDKTEMTNSDVNVTIKSNEEIQEKAGWELSENKKELTKIYTNNVTEIIEVYDLVGNKTQAQINISNIDKIVPELEIIYDKTEMTNLDVEVTIKSNEEIQEKIGWELSKNKKELTKKYIANKTEKIEIYDIAGNSEEVTVMVQNIDKTAPEVDVKTSKEESTNEDILVTITSNEEIQEVIGWNLSDDKLTLTKVYDKNIQEKIEIKDLVGNITMVDINIINIDKNQPVIKVDYSKEEITNSNVVVIITCDEEIHEIEGWELSEDKKTLSKTYEKNEKEIIEVRDLAGNITKIEINITNIDKDIPQIEVIYSETEKTNKDIIVTINSNEKLENITGWELSEDKKVLRKTYKQNIEETIEIKDLVGNTVVKTIVINNIDKENPFVETKYIFSKDKKQVKVEIISNEELEQLDGWNISKDKKTLTKIYNKNVQDKLELEDLVGNVTVVKIKIDGIKEGQPNNPEKDTIDKVDNSATTEQLPNAGGERNIINIVFISCIIFIGITVYKLNKYKDI